MKKYKVTFISTSGMEIEMPVEAMAPRHAELICKAAYPKPKKFISVIEFE